MKKRIKFSIEPEFTRISQAITSKKTEINHEADAKGFLHSSHPIEKQAQEIPKLINTEIMRIVKDNDLSRSDIDKIIKFIDEKSKISAANDNHIHAKTIKTNTAKHIAPNMKALKQRVINQFLTNKKLKRNDKIKFWITFAITTIISISALVVSVISLIRSSG